MVTTVRPIPDSYYWSGQGRLGIGSRNETTGELYDMLFVGNVTSLTIDIAVKKFEHKESMSGDRSIDLTIIQEKNATFKFTSESLDLPSLAAGLYGNTAAVTGATATAEIHLARRGYAIPLKHPNVTSVTTIATVTGSTALVENTDYRIDKENGTIYILAATTVVDADPGKTSPSPTCMVATTAWKPSPLVRLQNASCASRASTRSMATSARSTSTARHLTPSRASSSSTRNSAAESSLGTSSRISRGQSREPRNTSQR